MFWETQPKEFFFKSKAAPPDENRLWVEYQHGKFQAYEELLMAAGLWKEFTERCYDFFGWSKDWGVFTLLPNEIEGRNKVALQLLKEKAVLTAEGA